MSQAILRIRKNKRKKHFAHKFFVSFWFATIAMPFCDTKSDVLHVHFVPTYTVYRLEDRYSSKIISTEIPYTGKFWRPF